MVRESVVKYLAIGDSLTVGYGSSYHKGGFVPIYKSFAEQALNTRVRTMNIGVDGFTAKQIYGVVRSQSPSSIAEANLITITGGGNDLLAVLEGGLSSVTPALMDHAIKEAICYLQQTVGYITKIKKQTNVPYRILVFNSYNPFGPIPIANRFITEFNRALQSITRLPNVQVVDVYRVFKGNERVLLYQDHVHPNDKGYRLMAEEAAKKGFTLKSLN